ncbi:unnamed protein product [Amaranthus hypochondriacus]
MPSSSSVYRSSIQHSKNVDGVFYDERSDDVGKRARQLFESDSEQDFFMGKKDVILIITFGPLLVLARILNNVYEHVFSKLFHTAYVPLSLFLELKNLN